jgi:Formate hydrogenlyase subunit 6/NADH:ubiquinone oxidoreductase 23 kD subunit (chain I)
MGSFGIFKMVTGWALQKPATRLYPFVKREPYANTRGSIEIDIQKCTFCTLCQKKCPTEAIVVKKPEKTWEIDRLRCISCGACVDTCPRKCLLMLQAYSPSVTAKGLDSFVQKQAESPVAAE